MRSIVTAFHEAGHAVAHVRLGIQQASCTIVPEAFDGGVRLGSVLAESDEWTTEGALDQVLAYCAGYAAVLAAGFPDEVALDGADDDFERAEILIGRWELAGGIEAARERAVAFMSTPENVAAVRLIAERLQVHQTIDGDELDILVDLSDGEITPEEFERYLVTRRQVLGY